MDAGPLQLAFFHSVRLLVDLFCNRRAKKRGAAIPIATSERQRPVFWGRWGQATFKFLLQSARRESNPPISQQFTDFRF